MSLPCSVILAPNVQRHNNDAKLAQNTNVNVVIDNSSKVEKKREEEVRGNGTEAMYTSPYAGCEFPSVAPIMERSVSLEDDKYANLNDSVEFLKQVVRSYQENVIYFNKYVVLRQEDLIELLQTLLHADSIEIQTDSDGINCCSFGKFQKIDQILVTKDGKVVNLKYGYQDVYGIITQYNISLKVILVK